MIEADANKRRSIPGTEWNKDVDPEQVKRAVKDYLTTLDDLAYGSASEVAPKFWSSVGPSHNVFVVESFMDELAAAAKQDPVAYRLALLDKTPRAKLSLRSPRRRPAGVGRCVNELAGVSLQHVFATYLATVAEVEVSADGSVRVRRVVCGQLRHRCQSRYRSGAERLAPRILEHQHDPTGVAHEHDRPEHEPAPP